MFKAFLEDKYNYKTALINGGKQYTFLDLKQIISANLEKIKTKKDNIVISTDDNFSFVVQFFTSIFAKKNIYLISDIKKLNSLEFDYDLAEDTDFDKKEDYKFNPVNPEEIIINFYTSGTTSKPKIIKKSLLNLIKEGYDTGKEFDLQNKAFKVVSTTTMCHLFGMTFHLMMPLCNGLIIDCEKISYPENINKPDTILVSTPAFLNSVLKYDIPFTLPPKYIISAGSRLENDIFKELEKSSKIIEIYGSTESGVIAHREHFSDELRVFKNVIVKPNENNTEIISDYLWGKSVIINDKTELSDNILKLKSRTDRLFKILEKRVSADELEYELKNNEFIKQSYIIKNNDKLACLNALSQKGKEFLIQNGITELIKELKKYLLKTNEIIPQKWKFIDELPLNRAGKINKKLIEHFFNVNLSLPVILDRVISQNSVVYKIFFYKQCNFFKGHFPEFKLVPGVLQLYLAKEFANAHFDLNLGEGQWKRIKFSNIIRPDDIICLKLEKNDKQVNYEYFKENKKYSSGVFLCENIFEKALRN